MQTNFRLVSSKYIAIEKIHNQYFTIYHAIFETLNTKIDLKAQPCGTLATLSL